MHCQPGFQMTVFEGEDLPVPRGHREKPSGPEYHLLCRFPVPVTPGPVCRGQGKDGGVDSRHRGRQSPSRPSLCLPNWAAGQVHWTGEGRRVHKARSQLV